MGPLWHISTAFACPLKFPCKEQAQSRSDLLVGKNFLSVNYNARCLLALAINAFGFSKQRIESRNHNHLCSPTARSLAQFIILINTKLIKLSFVALPLVLPTGCFEMRPLINRLATIGLRTLALLLHLPLVCPGELRSKDG